MKPGIKTSEFWLAVATQVLGLLNVLPLPPVAYPIITGLYIISRGLAKAGVIRGTAGEVLQKLPEKP